MIEPTHEENLKEIGELIDDLEPILMPYSPNRKTRRDQEKRNRALQKRDLRG